MRGSACMCGADVSGKDTAKQGHLTSTSPQAPMFGGVETMAGDLALRQQHRRAPVSLVRCGVLTAPTVCATQAACWLRLAGMLQMQSPVFA